MTKLDLTYLVKILKKRKDSVQFSLANLQERIDHNFYYPDEIYRANRKKNGYNTELKRIDKLIEELKNDK